MPRILVIDDEPGICRALERFFKEQGNEVRTSSRAETGLTLAEAYEPDVVLLDVRLPGMNGLTALRRLRRADPTLPVIVITAYGTMETAVEAVRHGAWDYVLKPLELAEIAEVVARAAESRKQAREVVIGAAAAPSAPPERPARSPDFVPLVGRTRAMQEVFKKIGAVSLSDVPVLLEGENGTGKEMTARAVHAASPRAGGPFEPVSCASIPDAQLETEIFGREGAPGRLLRAAGGTLFLDEVGPLPASVQGRLVRLLDAGDGPDVRVIAATQTDLKAAVEAGRFREDLYYRLATMSIVLPPLRERAADVPALVAHFLTGPDGPRGAISRDALRILVGWSWPGNVGELRSAVEHALVLARGGTILPVHLPEHVRHGGDPRSEADGSLVREIVTRMLDSGDLPEGRVYQAVMDRFEEPLVGEVMKRTGGNQVKASKFLGIHRTTLRTKLAKYDLA